MQLIHNYLQIKLWHKKEKMSKLKAIILLRKATASALDEDRLAPNRAATMLPELLEQDLNSNDDISAISKLALTGSVQWHVLRLRYFQSWLNCYLFFNTTMSTRQLVYVLTLIKTVFEYVKPVIKKWRNF